MMRFFAEIKRMLRASAIEDALAAPIHRMIREEFIPMLEKEKDKYRGKPREQQEIELLDGMIQMYREWSDPRTPEGKSYGEVAWRVINNVVVDVTGLSHNEAEEFAAEIVRHSLPGAKTWREQDGDEPPKVPLADLIKYLRRFDPIGHTPDEFRKLWMRNVEFRTRELVRNDITRHPEKYHKNEPIEDSDGGEESDPLDTQSAPSKVEEDAWVKDVLTEMDEHLRGRLTKSQQMLYDKWHEVFIQQGMYGPVNMRQDVYPVVLKQIQEEQQKDGTSSKNMVNSVKTLTVWWTDIQQELRDFFADIGIMHTDKGKSLVKRFRTSTDVVAYYEFRRRLSAWILGKTT